MVSTSVARGPGTCPTLDREREAGISAVSAFVTATAYYELRIPAYDTCKYMCPLFSPHLRSDRAPS